MILDVWYDSYKLTDYCIVRNIYPSTPTKGEGVKVDINITIKNDIRYNLDMLNRILYTNEPKPLVISDTEDRYLLCELDGGIELTSRFLGADATISFKSNDQYWYSNSGEKVADFDGLGIIEVNNEGSAPAVPSFDVSFPSDSGFLSIIAPNGYIALGDKQQKTTIELPMQQLAMNEEMHETDMSDWTRLASDSHSGGLWVPDYNKLSLRTGQPSFDEWGTRLTKSTSPKAGHYWNSWGYTRNFNTIEDEIHRLTNFKLQSRITFEDQSGKTSNTGMFLIVLMDKDNKPIMTTSIYNVLGNSNEVTMSAKINEFSGSGNYRSKIVKEAKFPNGFNGNIQMTKEGSKFTWIWDSGKAQNMSSTVEVRESFSVGATVYIKASARYGYSYDGVAHNIQGFTRGRANRVQATRTWNGKKQVLITYSGVQIYWMNEEDVTANRSGVGKTVKQTSSSGQRTVTYSTRNTQLATLTASKVLVIGGTWDSSDSFSRASINSMTIHRLNEGDRFAKVANTFSKGDKLTINNSTGEILHNGMTFQGLVDVDSRFFDIDYGRSELQLVTSGFAALPQAQVRWKERFR